MTLCALSLYLTSPVDVTLPHDTGRASYAATLTHLRPHAPDLIDAVHNADGTKPLTCSRLMGAKTDAAGTQVHAGAQLRIRVTGLTAEMTAALDAAFLQHTPETWTLFDHPFTVQRVVCDGETDPWTGQADYATLAAQGLMGGPNPAPAVTLHFAAPTAFKSKGVHLPVPLPELVFGSLVDRWNAFSPVTVSGEMRQFGAEMIAISRYRLSSRGVQTKPGVMRIGGVGTVTYRALGGDRYWWRVMHMLADFARFGGVGILTTTGMGQCRRADDQTRR